MVHQHVGDRESGATRPARAADPRRVRVDEHAVTPVAVATRYAFDVHSGCLCAPTITRTRSRSMPSCAPSARNRGSPRRVSAFEMKRLDVDVAGEPAFDTWDAVAALTRRTTILRPGRPVIRNRGTMSKFALPAHAPTVKSPQPRGRLDRLPHHCDVAGLPQRLSRREPAGAREIASDRSVTAGDRVGPAGACRQRRGAPNNVDASDAVRLPCSGDIRITRCRSNHLPAPERRRTSSRRDLRRFHRRRPGRVESPHREKTTHLRAARRRDLRQAISGITVYSANVDVPNEVAHGSPPADSRVVPSGR